MRKILGISHTIAVVDVWIINDRDKRSNLLLVAQVHKSHVLLDCLGAHTTALAGTCATCGSSTWNEGEKNQLQTIHLNLWQSKLRQHKRLTVLETTISYWLLLLTGHSQFTTNGNNTVNFSLFPIYFFAPFRIRPLRTQGRKEAEEGRESKPYIFSRILKCKGTLTLPNKYTGNRNIIWGLYTNKKH